MARNNGSNGGIVDIASTVEDFQTRITRLKELGKVKAGLDKEQLKLDEQQSEIDAEIAALTGVATPVKVGRKPKEGNKPRGNGTNGPRGTSLRSVLLKVMPGSESDGISKDDIAALVAKEGYTSNAAEPKVVIGQTLGKFRDFHNVSRGLWRLNKAGEKNRDKMLAEGVEPEAVENDASTPEAPAAEATAPVVTEQPAPVADEQPVVQTA